MDLMLAVIQAQIQHLEHSLLKVAVAVVHMLVIVVKMVVLVVVEQLNLNANKAVLEFNHNNLATLDLMDLVIQADKQPTIVLQHRVRLLPTLVAVAVLDVLDTIITNLQVQAVVLVNHTQSLVHQ
jgi:hypothetical protein